MKSPLMICDTASLCVCVYVCVFTSLCTDVCLMIRGYVVCVFEEASFQSIASL